MHDRQRPNQDDDLPQSIREYWERYAEAFAIPLRGNGLLGTFVSNPAVTGAYAEAWVRSLACFNGIKSHHIDRRSDKNN